MRALGAAEQPAGAAAAQDRPRLQRRHGPVGPAPPPVRGARALVRATVCVCVCVCVMQGQLAKYLPLYRHYNCHYNSMVRTLGPVPSPVRGVWGGRAAWPRTRARARSRRRRRLAQRPLAARALSSRAGAVVAVPRWQRRPEWPDALRARPAACRLRPADARRRQLGGARQRRALRAYP